VRGGQVSSVVTPWLRDAELDEWSAGEALGFFALGAQEGEGQVESFDFAAPVLAFGVLAAGDQVASSSSRRPINFGLTCSIGQRMLACSCWQGVP